MPRLSSVTVSLNLPYIGGIEGTWIPNADERKAAWELYVELVTRSSIAELQESEGILRETLSSMYSLFDSTRRILREYGPEIAQSQSGSDFSFGYLAIAILNSVVRPLLSKWHPLLKDHEDERLDGVSIVDHEHNWTRYAELRAELSEARLILIEYANLLAEVADVPKLH